MLPSRTAVRNSSTSLNLVSNFYFHSLTCPNINPSPLKHLLHPAKRLLNQELVLQIPCRILDVALEFRSGPLLATQEFGLGPLAATTGWILSPLMTTRSSNIFYPLIHQLQPTSLSFLPPLPLPWNSQPWVKAPTPHASLIVHPISTLFFFI